jgi:hypothetical protein
MIVPGTGLRKTVSHNLRSMTLINYLRQILTKIDDAGTVEKALAVPFYLYKLHVVNGSAAFSIFWYALLTLIKRFFFLPDRGCLGTPQHN